MEPSPSSNPSLLNPPGPRPGRTRLVFALVGLALVGGIVAAVKVVHDIDDTVRDCYAVWWVAGMVNTYMDLNDGKWPNGWEDLEEPYEVDAARSGRPWTFDELRNRVDVDFTANPAELAKSVLKDGKATFRVVFLRNGKEHHWEYAEPNVLIWEHLQQRANSEGQEPQKPPVTN